MTFGLRRADLQKMAEAKLEDSILLFNSNRFSNAYYLCGYSVEFALKACIAKRIAVDTIPDKKFITAIYVHSYPDLVGLAGLRRELKERQDKDAAFHANWAIAAEWSPDARYEAKDRSTAQFLIKSVADRNHGVLAWIKSYW